MLKSSPASSFWYLLLYFHSQKSHWCAQYQAGSSRAKPAPRQNFVLLPSYPPPAAHHRIALPRASTPFKPPLNCNTGRPLSFAPFHMLITLFVVEFYSSKWRPSPPRPRRRANCRRVLLFLYNCHTGRGGKSPVQCGNFDLCIFLDREPFIHT